MGLRGEGETTVYQRKLTTAMALTCVGKKQISSARVFALHRIKPPNPPLFRAPVNSFEFELAALTPQAGERESSIYSPTINVSRRGLTRVANSVLLHPRFRYRKKEKKKKRKGGGLRYFF